jgi:hypothetical protein
MFTTLNGGMYMFNFALVTTLEIAAVLLIILGFIYEEKVIDFEDRVLRNFLRRLNLSKRHKAELKRAEFIERSRYVPEIPDDDVIGRYVA